MKYTEAPTVSSLIFENIQKIVPPGIQEYEVRAAKEKSGGRIFIRCQTRTQIKTQIMYSFTNSPNQHRTYSKQIRIQSTPLEPASKHQPTFRSRARSISIPSPHSDLRRQT